MKLRSFLLVGLCLLILPGVSGAAALSLTATDSGFVTEAGSTDKFDGLISPATGNYSVGFDVACEFGGLCPGTFVPMQRKNYFTFDLTGISDSITAASLKLYNPPGGYESGDPSETYVLGATDPALVPSVLAKLEAIGMVGSTAEVDDGCGDPGTPTDDPLICDAVGLYDELAGSLGAVGPEPVELLDPAVIALGLVDMSAADDDSIVEITFTADGIAYLNDFLGGTLVLGGALASSDPTEGTPQTVFGFSSATTLPAPALSLTTVPLPGSLILLVSALPVLGLARQRRRG